MKYLVLRRFWSYGKMLEKGTVVDESEIRSPKLRMSEGKITPAVSSLRVPEDFGAIDAEPQVFSGNENTEPTPEPELEKPVEEPAEVLATELKKKRLVFNKKEE